MSNTIESEKTDNESVGTNTSNSDIPNINNKREKRTRNRPSKSERYTQEREELIEELNILIGLNNNKNNVILYELEHNEELKLRELVPEIKKYYRTCCWGYFSW
jgi:hypothetical protein